MFNKNDVRPGLVRDLVARLGSDPHSQVVGAVIRIEVHDPLLPIREIGELVRGRGTFEGKRINLRKFERRPIELLLAEDLRARHLMNLVSGRLIAATEIELSLSTFDRRFAQRGLSSLGGVVAKLIPDYAPLFAFRE